MALPQRQRTAALCSAAIVALALAGLQPAYGVIRRLFTLEEIMALSEVIATAEIISVDADPRKRTAVAQITGTIKGTSKFTRINMNFSVGQEWYPEAMVTNLKIGDPVVFFYADQGGGKLGCVAHTNGFWFQLFGKLTSKPDEVWWNFTHIEIWLNRTFEGTTPELETILRDVLAGKRQPPPPNPDKRPLARADFFDDNKRKMPITTVPLVIRSATGEPSTQKVDGFESHTDWRVADWADPATLETPSTAARGRVMQIDYRPGGTRQKVAVTCQFDVDLSAAQRLVFEACNQSDKPVAVAIGFNTPPDWQYFESPPVTLPPGVWRYDCTVDLETATFKTATDSEFASPILDREHVTKLMLLVYDTPPEGRLIIDRLVPDDGKIFVRALPLPHAGGQARGVAWADFDNDDDLDAFVCSSQMNRLYRNDAGEFVDVTGEVGLRGGSRCAGWADYDGDGDLDLFVSTPALWTNSDGTFRDDSALLPTLARRNTEGAGWIDANGDGRPDILISNGESGIVLFLNQGGPTTWFTDASSEWGLGKSGIGVGNGDFLSIADFDADGFPDFLYNYGNGVLARNAGGRLFEPALDAGVQYEVSNSHKLGTAFGDFDNDGDLDIFVPQRRRSRLLQNNNDFTYTDIFDDAGELTALPGNARSAAAADFNGDGMLDLVIGFHDAPARLYLNLGHNTFTDASAASGLARYAAAGDVTGLAPADWDHDGDMDLLIMGERTHAAVLINGAPKNQDPHSMISIRLPRTTVPGTIIRLYGPDGGILGMRQPGLAQNFSSHAPPGGMFAVRPGSYTVSVLSTDGTLATHALVIDSARSQPHVIVGH